MYTWYLGELGFPGGSAVKNLPEMQETQVWSLDQRDPLEESMAIPSSIPAGKIPGTQEPSGLQSMGSQRVGDDESYWAQHALGDLQILWGLQCTNEMFQLRVTVILHDHLTVLCSNRSFLKDQWLHFPAIKKNLRYNSCPFKIYSSTKVEKFEISLPMTLSQVIDMQFSHVIRIRSTSEQWLCR